VPRPWPCRNHCAYCDVASADRRVVTIASTRHHVVTASAAVRDATPGAIPVQRKRKRKDASGVDVLDGTVPPATAFYQENYGGVDLADQRIAECSTQQPSSTRWYMCLFYKAVDIAINNAIVLHCIAKHKGPGEVKFRDQLRFRSELVDEVLKEQDVFIPTHKAIKDLSRADAAAVHGDCMPHMPFKVGGKARKTCCYVGCKPVPRSELKSSGKLHSQRPLATFYCRTCSMHLCMTSTRNCFVDHHNLKFASGSI
jgi:hypothetical protein